MQLENRRAVLLGDDFLLIVFFASTFLPAGMILATEAAAAKPLLVTIFTLLVLCIAMVILSITKHIPSIIVWVFLFSLPYAIVVALKGGLVHLAYLAAILAILFVAVHARFGSTFWRVALLLIFAIELGYLFHWLGDGMNPQFQAIMPHKNFLGMQLFFFFIVLFGAHIYLRKRLESIVALVGMLMSLLLFALSGSRTPLLSTIIFVALYFSWPLISSRSKYYWAALLLTLLGSFVLVPAYILLWLSPWGSPLDALISEVTGQALFSGRQFVWPAYMEVALRSPLWGQGFDIDLLARATREEGLPTTYSDLSTHNLYLMIAVQTGIAGLVGFSFLVGGIWALLGRNRRHIHVRFAGPAFLAFLVHEIFEVSLVQNNLVGAWPIWILVAMAMRIPKDLSETRTNILGSQGQNP